MHDVLERLDKLAADIRKLSEELNAHISNAPKKQAIDVHHHFDPAFIGLLEKMHQTLCTIQTQGEKIMATQAELAAQLTAATEKLKKIGSETTTLLTKVKDLTDIIAGGTIPVTPELQAAADALTAQAGVVDDLVPDVTT